MGGGVPTSKGEEWKEWEKGRKEMGRGKERGREERGGQGGKGREGEGREGRGEEYFTLPPYALASAPTLPPQSQKAGAAHAHSVPNTQRHTFTQTTPRTQDIRTSRPHLRDACNAA